MDLLCDVSSDTIGKSGVSFSILFVTILFISKSPLLTGVPSGLISLVKPLFLNSIDTLPA